MGFFGIDDGDKKRQDMYDKVSNYDNRMNDFKSYSGTALNNLANRGVINSTVGANAMSNALTQSEKNYWDDQMKLLLGYNYNQDNDPGMFAPLMQGIGSAGGAILGGVFGGPTGASIGSSAGGMFGGSLGSGLSSIFR